ncbi:MAG: hypothetical protein BWX58_01101 [Deltaproteobacteria bacterium ADurb.Bin026]|nr:MAG: hypothetical protein BWX58_01101 [Deltaproteobacteria bacterium ADurb.Bin026]
MSGMSIVLSKENWSANMSICSYPLLMLCFCGLSVFSRIMWSTCDLLSPIESKQPAFARLSSTFLFAFLESISLRNCAKDLKPPSSSLNNKIWSIAASPTFLMPDKPYRIFFSPRIEKYLPLWFMSGGKIFMPFSLHSVMYLISLSVLFTSLESIAVT